MPLQMHFTWGLQIHDSPEPEPEPEPSGELGFPADNSHSSTGPRTTHSPRNPAGSSGPGRLPQMASTPAFSRRPNTHHNHRLTVSVASPSSRQVVVRWSSPVLISCASLFSVLHRKLRVFVQVVPCWMSAWCLRH